LDQTGSRRSRRRPTRSPATALSAARAADSRCQARGPSHLAVAQANITDTPPPAEWSYEGRLRRRRAIQGTRDPVIRPRAPSAARAIPNERSLRRRSRDGPPSRRRTAPGTNYHARSEGRRHVLTMEERR
jgi:hypothetical protein